MKPKATRLFRVGKSSGASGTKGTVRPLLCRRAQPPSVFWEQGSETPYLAAVFKVSLLARF